MKKSLLLAFVVLVIPSFSGASEPIRELDLREKLVLELAKAWNKSSNVGEFLERNVDPKVPLKDRKRFVRLTDGYRWVSLPKAVPMKDTLLLRDGKFRTVSAIQVKSLRPLEVSYGGETKKFDDIGAFWAYLESVERALPEVLRGSAKGRHAWDGLLVPDARALEPVSMIVGAAALGAGALAYSAFAGVRRTDVHVDNTTNNYTTINLNVPDTMSVNMHNLTEEVKQARAEELRQAKVNFRSDLGKWVNANVSAGSCEAPGTASKFGPHVATKSTDLLPEMTFTQTENDGAHVMDIAVAGRPVHFQVEKVFAKDSNLSPDHRIFADEVTTLRRCDERGCKPVDQEAFDKGMIETVGADLVKRTKQEEEADRKTVDVEIAKMKAELESVYEPAGKGAKIAKKYQPELDAAEAQYRADVSAPNEAVRSIQAQVRRLVREDSSHGGWFGNPKTYDLSRDDASDIADALLDGETREPEGYELRQERFNVLRRKLEKYGVLADYEKKVAAVHEIDNAYLATMAEINDRKGKEYEAAGLYSNGNPKKNAYSIIWKSPLCARRGSAVGNECDDLVAGARAAGSVESLEPDFAAFREAALERLGEKREFQREALGKKLADQLATNYALAYCCDETECHDILTRQMRQKEKLEQEIRDNGGNGAGVPGQ